MKQSNTSTLLSLCALVIVFALVGGDLAGLAQNTNSSTTNDAAQSENTNANMSRRGRRGRRGRRATPPAPPADTMATPTDTTGTMGGTMQGGATGTLGRVGDTASLDGTYTGMINYPDGGMTGDATLTINGNTFTLESGGNTQTGTLTVQTWPGYTAVSMRFGTDLPAKIVSARAWHHGNSLRLQSVSGESHAFSFHSGGGGMGGGRRGGRRRRGTMAMPPPPPPADTTTPAAGETPAETATPAAGRRRRRGRRRGGNTNMNTNTGDNTNNSNTQ